MKGEPKSIVKGQRPIWNKKTNISSYRAQRHGTTKLSMLEAEAGNIYAWHELLEDELMKYFYMICWFAYRLYVFDKLFVYTKSVEKKLLQFFPLAFQGGLLLHVRHLLCRALDEKLKGMSLSNDTLTEDHYLPTIWEAGLERLAKKTTRGIPKVPMNGCRVFLLSHIMLSTRVQKDLFSATSWNHTCWCVFGVSTCWQAS